MAGEDVARSSRQLSTAWRDEGWLELTKSSNTYEAPFANEDEIITELVNRMAFTVENIRVDKFEKPLGDLEPGNELPDIIESSNQDSVYGLLKMREMLFKVFISPLQHQLHHSSDPRRIGRNFGSKFAIWDLCFGTLMIGKEIDRPLRFGITR